VIADCIRSPLGRTIAVQLGTVARPQGEPGWSGGRVTGYLAQAPDSRSLLRQLVDHRPPGTMVVADPPLAGLSANPGPDLSEIPNNHRSYMVQWWLFAAVALVVYGVALRARWRKA
jgi:surfeit locus 1 family protein